MAPAVTLPSRTAPPVATGHPQDYLTPPTKALPQWLIDGAQISDPTPFDATKHLNFQFPSNIYTMKDIGYEGQGISDTAISEPFPLFNQEAIRQMRAEIFSRPVLAKYQVATKMATNMIRSYTPEYALFIYNAWHSPEVVEAVSRVAGIELVPVLDADIGHVNISVTEKPEPLGKILEKGVPTDQSAFSWHYDAYAFVCVTMLSDCTGMVGGETMIRTGDGQTMKARGPSMGTAVVMKGRYIEHQALKALGGRERISMVTAFRPKSPYVVDETSCVV